MYKKIMIIDDYEIDRYVVARNAKKYGLAEEVVGKESANAALEYLSLCAECPGELPQLIFLDINMPEMSGFGFLELYEKLPETVRSNCVIIMLSTSLNPADHDLANANKCVSRFLNKPLDKEKIELLITESAA
jgi:CheY-like chemotaxis protein